MDTMSIVSSMMSAQAGRAQMTIAASIAKTNAGHDKEIAQLIQAGNQNLSNAAAGLGQNLDITV